jgi:hypothetical protein
MVDQTKLNGNGTSAHRNSPAGDETESLSPSGAVAQSSAEFLHDLVTLAELQVQLVALDGKQGLTRLVTPVAGVLFGAILALGCVPVALATIALVLTETTDLSPARSFAIVVGVGGVVALLLIAGCAWLLKRSLKMFSRSQREWQQNIRWFKETLRRLRSKPTAAQASSWSAYR